MTAALVEEIAVKASVLPIELQREALDFIEFIAHKATNSANVGEETTAQPLTVSDEPKKQFKSVLGSLEHLNVHVTLEDIAEVRREMWANFPREEPRS